MKRLLSLLLALVLVIGMVPVSAQAATLDNGLVYKVYADHVEITDYTGNATEVIIPAEIEGKLVTAIDRNAFYQCSSLTSIVIPDSVTSIGAYAFSHCSSLTGIVIPDSISIIEDGTFSDCSVLTDVVIPDSVTSIGDRAFSYCENLSNIKLSANLTHIGRNAFSQCSSLVSIAIPDGVSTIAEYTFWNCSSLTDIDLPDNLATIEDYAFFFCESLTDIDLPDSLTSIGENAFSCCSSLTSIAIPDGVSAIAEDTFWKCSGMTDVDLPDGVTSIGNRAFGGCSSLTSIAIPDSVTDINEEAFSGCSSLTSVELSQGITTISNSTFSDCSSLVSIKIPDGVTYIGDSAFSHCSSLTGIELPEGVTSIGDGAFSFCTNLVSATIPDGVISIGGGAFYYCESLTSMELPDSVISIGIGAFGGCSSLTSIKLSAGLTSIGPRAFYYCTSLTSIELPEGVTEIGDSTFYNCSSLTSIVIPDSVTSIGYDAFTYNKSLTILEIPDSVTYIGDEAFEFCESLTGIHVDENNPNYSSDDRGVLFDKAKTHLIRAPGGITGAYTIPDGVTKIGYSAFCDCQNLTGVELPDGVTSIGAYAFAWCETLTSINLPISITYIDSCAFLACYSLPSIEIPCGVIYIGSSAFNACGNLSKIYFTGDAPVFDDSTFYDVIATAYYPTDNTTWTSDVMKGYGGYLRWTPYTAPVHTHEYASTVHAPTCTRTGLTICTCICGDRYVTDYVDSLGHDYADGVCKQCGKSESENQKPSRPTDPSFGMFASEDTLTRGMFAYALWNYYGSPEPYYFTQPFADVSESIYYHDAVYWAVESGILSGMNPIKFSPDSSMNRAEAVTFLWRAAGSPEPADLNPFTDVSDRDFFYKAALWVTLEGLCMEPLDFTHFGPYEKCLYGHINWLAVNHTHEYTAAVTSPTCTSRGYTTYICSCGQSYVNDYVDAMGHDYGDITCTRCGSVNPDFVAKNPFDDVPAGAFYEIPVIWAIENGITNGATRDTFDPSNQCLRAHVVTFLWRANGCPEPTTTDNSFTDVKESDFFYDAVLWAVENGITTGVSADKFGSYDVCNRAQVVTFLHRAMESPAVATTDLPFTDVPAGAWYEAPIAWAVENGITNGLSATQFGPNAACNRAQVVTFLYRAYND